MKRFWFLSSIKQFTDTNHAGHKAENTPTLDLWKHECGDGARRTECISDHSLERNLAWRVSSHWPLWQKVQPTRIQDNSANRNQNPSHPHLRHLSQRHLSRRESHPWRPRWPSLAITTTTTSQANEAALRPQASSSSSSCSPWYRFRERSP